MAAVAPRRGRPTRLGPGLALLFAAPAVSGADGPAATVAAVRFEGVRSIPEAALSSQLLTHGPRWLGLAFWEPDLRFDAADLEEDLERVPQIYREYGFFEASAESRLDWDDEGREVEVTIVVVEGEPVRLAEVQLDFVPDHRLDAETREALRDVLDLAEGEVFGSRAYTQARQALLDTLAERGFPGASLEGGARVDTDAHRASVEWMVDPGPLVRIGDIQLAGLERVDPSLARRELTFAEGDVYSLAAQRESEVKLRDTELFHAVAIQPRPPERKDGAPPPDEESWPLEVRVRERKPRSVRVGVGYGTEEEVRGQIAWRHRNFLGGGRKLELRGEYSSLRGGGEVRFAQPHFLDPETDLTLENSLVRDTPPAFDALRLEERLQLSRPVVAPWTVRGGQAFEYADVLEVRADDPGEEGTVRVSSLFAGIRRDTLDDRLEPERGTWLDLYAEPSLEAIGSSASFLTLIADGRAFHPWWRLVFGTRLKLGAIEPLSRSSVDDVPIVRRFFSGGSNSVRGYGYQELGPLDDEGEPLGALSLAEASIEVRAPLFWRLSLVGFLDGGQLSRRPWTFRSSEVQLGAGPGVRLETPVGPLRFDLGFPLDRDRGIDPYRIHFAIGHAF